MTSLQDIIIARQSTMEELTIIAEKLDNCLKSLLASNQAMNAEYRELEKLEEAAASKLDEADQAFANYIPQNAQEFTMQLEAIVVSSDNGIEQPSYIHTIWRGAQTLLKHEMAA